MPSGFYSGYWILAFLWVLILIPVIVYFMRVYEGREISSGQAANRVLFMSATTAIFVAKLSVTINDDSLNIFTVLACRQLNPDVDVMARAVHVDAVDRLHMAGANHVLSESILGFQLMQIAMVEMGVLPKLTGHVVREVTWTGEPVTIGELTKRHNGQYKIICGVRDGRVVQPTLDLVLEQNEKLVVMAPPSILESYFH